MACGILYRDAIIITTIKKGDDSFLLDTPFRYFGCDVVRNGEMVTYSLEKLEGQEVMAKVDYRVEDDQEVKKFAGYLGDPKKSAKYNTHYPVTIADAKATYYSEGLKIPYNGADKDEKADFCEALCFKNLIGEAIEK